MRWCSGSAPSPGKYRSTRLSGHTRAAFHAVPTAAAPPPITAMDAASASRRWASSMPAATSSAVSRPGRRQNPLLTPVEMTRTSYGSSAVLPSGQRDDDRLVRQVEAGDHAVHDAHPVEADKDSNEWW